MTQFDAALFERGLVCAPGALLTVTGMVYIDTLSFSKIAKELFRFEFSFYLLYHVSDVITLE